MDLDMKTIGLRIKERRKELRLTQIDIKNSVGISSGNISDIENGNRLPSASTLVQLSHILQCSIDWMLTGNIPQSENIHFSASGDTIEIELLNGFRKLSEDDRGELLEIMHMKLRKIKGDAEAIKSSTLTNTGIDSMIG